MGEGVLCLFKGQDQVCFSTIHTNSCLNLHDLTSLVTFLSLTL